MPRARRRRRHPAGRTNWGRTVVLAAAATLTLVLLVGSVAEIHAQSSGYRRSAATGFDALASRIAAASSRTGAELATAMAAAPATPNQLVPYFATARAELEQSLDTAVEASASQASQASSVGTSFPTGAVGAGFVHVMADRATGVAELRTTVDELLGMSPLPIAGAPATTTTTATGPLLSIDQAARQLEAVGLLFQQSDDEYRSVAALGRQQPTPIGLPRSVWVPRPYTSSPLSAVALADAAGALAGSASLVPFHELIISSVGLTPPAVATGGIGIVADSCAQPVTAVPTATPTVLPPTASVSAEVTVTNCGTVPETDVVVTALLAVADPPGTAPPPAGATGGRTRATATSVRPGGSTAVTLPPLTVASGHLYGYSIAVVTPPSQASPAGSTQTFFLQITA